MVLMIRRRCWWTTRPVFYAVKMTDKEKAIAYISRVRQLASDLNAIDEVVSDQEIAVIML